MKKSLLATVAVAALMAGPALAQRQEAPASDVKGAAPPPASIQNAPAEKIAPAGKVAPDRAADTKAPKLDTTGQASPSGRSSGDSDIKARTGADTKSDTKASDKPGMNADTKSAPNAQTRSGATTDTTKSGAAAETKASASAPSLTAEQKARVRSTVLTANAPRATNINFSINVGTVVPRTVRVVAVPATLVEIHPAWRGYMYFVHGDDIIIVEPRTLRIVAVITA